MATTTAPQSSVLLFEQLCKAGSAVYIRNTMQSSKMGKGKVGDLLIGCVDPDTKREFTIIIPKNSVVCLNEQATTLSFANNQDLRRYIRENVLTVLNQEAYEALVAESPEILESSTLELSRVSNSMNGDNTPDITATETKNDFIRPEVAGMLVKAQMDSENEVVLLTDLKALMPFSQIEAQALKSALPSFNANYPSIKGFVLSL